MDYHVAKRRNAKAWDVLRKDATGKLYLVSSHDKLTRKEARAIAGLLAGYGARVITHDRIYPLAVSFPGSPFAQSHI